MKKIRVLFLCTGNSARSQLAEALLRRMAGDDIEVHSAGLAPKDVHPLTHQVLGEIGIDTRALRAKGLDEFMGKVSIHYAIIVCEKAAASCPRIYPFARQTLYWPFEDPAAFEGSPEQKVSKFREVRDLIDDRLRIWVDEVMEKSL